MDSNFIRKVAKKYSRRDSVRRSKDSDPKVVQKFEGSVRDIDSQRGSIRGSNKIRKERVLGLELPYSEYLQIY